MSVPTFASLLSEHLLRAGISDTELARSIGVRRQTVFRWKEGLVERPRSREDVLRCARKLRLTPEERDLLLLAAGFAPEELSTESRRDSNVTEARAPVPFAELGADWSLDDHSASTALTDQLQASDDEQDKDTEAPRDADEALDANEPLDANESLDANEYSDVKYGNVDVVTTSILPERNQTGAISTERGPEWDESSSLAAAQTIVDNSAGALAVPETLPTSRGVRSHPWFSANSRPIALAMVAGLAFFAIVVWRLLPIPAPPVEPVATKSIATEAIVQVTLNPPRATMTPSFPLIYPTAQPATMLLVVAPFDGYTVNEQYNVAGRIQDALTKEIADAGLISTTIEIWPEKIRNNTYLQEVLRASRATMVIWGEYDSGRVRVNLNGHGDLAQRRDFNLSSPDELITTITNTLPKEIQILSLVTLGRLLRDQDDHEAATTAFRHALALQPGDNKTRSLINFYLGHLVESERTLRSLSRAIDYYQQALADNPLLYDAQYNLGTAYLNRSYLYPADDATIITDLDAAIDQLSALIGERPTSELAHINRGIARYERHQGDDLTLAHDDFSYVIAINANNSKAYFHRALATLRAGESLQWIADLEKTLMLTPDYYPAQNGLCWGYGLAQQPDKALPYCNEAVARDPTAASRDSRAIVYAQLERYAEAVADFELYLTWIKTTYGERLYARNRGPLVEEWIEALKQEENPFTPKVLASLR